MHQTLTYKAKQNILFRLLPLLFAAIMLCSGAPTVVRFFRDQLQELTAVAPEKLPLSDHALKVTLDGAVTTGFTLQSYEKKTLVAASLKGKATYQWQICHPEKSDVWVNIYDATAKELPVSAALVKNMLTQQGTALLRCRAYNSDYAYLSDPIIVTLADTGSGSSGSGSGNSSTPSQNSTPITDDDNSEKPEFVTITIEYQLYGYVKKADGTMGKEPEMLGPAFSSYVAMLQYGSDLEEGNGKIHSPEIVGYTPYLVEGYAGDGTPILSSAEYVNIEQQNVTEDKTYIVQYRPALVDYEVRYFFQNVYDDLYVEDNTILDAEDKPALTVRTEGYTGMEPDTKYTERQFPGFTSLYYQPEAIAADGSTVFQVFFERDYYLMEFDCNGGYGADTIYVRYGTYISVPNPVRMGYEFAGWNKGQIQYDSNGQPLKDSEGRVIVKYEQTFDPANPDAFNPALLPSTMGTENTMYRAEWKSIKTTYTVAYWRGNSDGTGYEFWGNSIVGLGNNGHPDGSVVSNTQVSGIDDLTNLLPLCGLRGHQHDSTCDEVCGYEEHSHTDGACIYDCGYDYEHTHIYTDGVCYNCGKTVCTTHSRGCYSFSGSYTVNENIDTSNYINNLTYQATKNGLKIYKYSYDNRYYVAIGGSYYQIRNGNSNRINNFNVNNLTITQTCHVHDDSCKCMLEEHTHVDCLCTKTAHIHKESCLSCGLTEHTHIAGCYTDEDVYYTFERADQNVTVKGDGSTVVNVYYVPKIFEIRYVYARSNSGGTVYIANSTGDGALDDWDPHEATTLPEIKTGLGFTAKTESMRIGNTSYTLHYIAVRAKYGANIENQWPADAIEDVTDSGGHARRFGSWAAEPGTPYRDGDTTGHANIVGPYPYMNRNMINRNNTDDPITENGETYYLAQRMSAWWGSPDKGNFGGWDHGPITNHTYHIYLESLDGTGYILSRSLTFLVAHNTDTRVDPFIYTGYTCLTATNDPSLDDSRNFANNPACPNANTDDHCAYCNVFYYDRNEHTLSFYNYNDASTSLPSQKLKYEQSFSSMDMPGKPPYPAGIEPGAYEFVGWYTTPVFDEDTLMTAEKWASMKMPDGDVALYAKWVPIQRKVTFYYLYTDLGTDTKWKPTITVEHGSLLGTTYSYIPERDGYDFIGWFYMDQDNKKKFAPDSMEIRRDLQLFAEWHSKTDAQYEVSYKLEKEAEIDGVTYPAGYAIGEPTTGHASAGKTKTFTAKDRAQLNSPFNLDTTSLFPTLNSHSILMSDVPAENVFDFTYVVDEEVWYKVRYVDKTTNVELRPSKVLNTSKAVITEKFLPIQNYIPEQYYIRKVLASDDELGGSKDNVIAANEIIFYYIPDTEHALYTIEYYKEKMDGTFELVQSSVGSDSLNRLVSVTIDPDKYNGFTYKHTTVTTYTYNETEGKYQENPLVTETGTTVSGTLTPNGIEIRVYYTRNTYPYVIKFMKNGTTDVLGYGLLNPDGTVMMNTDGSPVFTLDEVKKANPVAKFEQTVSYMPAGEIKVDESSYRLVGYDSAHPELSEKSLTIRVENGAYDALVDNDLIFWYNERQTTVYYQAVCDAPGAIEFGVVTISRETTAAAANLGGSKASPGNGYKFLGWFDESGNPVNADWVDDKTEPGKYHLKPVTFIDHNNDDEIYYYARFAPISTELTVFNTGAGNSTQNFVFHVKGQGKLEYIDLTFVITGNGSVTIKDIPIGQYSVTKTDWSWEHTPKPETLNVTAAQNQTNEVTFQNTFAESNWLDGEAKR